MTLSKCAFVLTALIALPAMALAAPATDAELCRSQLDLLLSGEKLTDAEAAVFQAQCDCLQQSGSTGEAGRHAECAQGDASLAG